MRRPHLPPFDGNVATLTRPLALLWRPPGAGEDLSSEVMEEDEQRATILQGPGTFIIRQPLPVDEEPYLGADGP